jgi:hypothetical protein
MLNDNLTPIQFYDLPIEPIFREAPLHEKSPDCPDGFTWNGSAYVIIEQLAEWHDYTRRGRAARNMSPAHSAVAAGRGSLGVGRFYFRVRVQGGRCFDIYYDRAPKDADRRKGQWFIYRELVKNESSVE